MATIRWAPREVPNMPDAAFLCGLLQVANTRNRARHCRIATVQMKPGALRHIIASISMRRQKLEIAQPMHGTFARLRDEPYRL